MSEGNQEANNHSWSPLETIYSINLMANVLPEVIFDEEQFDIQAKYRYYSESFEQMKRELSSYGIQYKELQYALLPHQKDKEEIAFVFDANLIESKRGYIYDTLGIILKSNGLEEKKSTYAIMGGDIPYHPGAAKALERTLTRKTKDSISDSDFLVIYFNNLSKKQIDDIDAVLLVYDHYLGYVCVNQESLFRKDLAGCLPQICVISKIHAVIESSPESSTETNNPFSDLLRDNYDVAIITEDCYGTFLAYVITSVFPDTRNIALHINAIYPHQVDYSSDTVIVTQEKIDYLRNDEGKHRKWSAVFGISEYNIALFKKLIDFIQCNIVYNVVVKGPDRLHPEVIMFDIICCTTGADGIQYDCTLGFRILIDGQKIELVTAY